MSEHEHLNPEDPLPQLIAEIDQMIATAPHLANAAWGFFIAYREAGFSDKQAVYLTAAGITENDLEAP